MKIVISYPPFPDIKGIPMLSQNRQYQVFSEKTVIYPIVPAQAATLLKQAGHQVVWNDCIAEDWSYDKFLNFIQHERPDLIAFETKTPVVKQHWKIINEIKQLSTLNSQLSTVLMGDHVTALPEESMQNSQVDFVLEGGDYDFLLLNLCNSLRKQKESEQPSTLNPHPSAELEPGIWYRNNGQIRNTGTSQLNHDLNSLPFIDRDLTKWQLYAYENGNYKRVPGTYIMSGRDCYWGKCSFCSWTTLYTKFRVRSVDNVLDEIGYIIDNYPIKEIMDDTGTFPVGDWLMEFCEGMISRGYHKRVALNCNMRFGALSLEMYKLMHKAGFRFILYGLESANQRTLDRINKGITIEDIIDSCKWASEAGLSPHITIMFGYPWEDYEDAQKTLDLGKWLLKKDYAYTMQATIAIPYPGTSLFRECKEKDLLYSLDWSYYDMKNPVMKLNFPPSKLLKLVQSMYSISFSPEFIIRKISSIRDFGDIKYFWRAFLKVVGHIVDFESKTL